jgi:uncharacterized SAM-binding protein YcdF (DUF218 family)
VTVRSRQSSSPDQGVDEGSPLDSGRPRGSRLHRRLGVVALVLFLAFAATTARVFVWPSLPPLPAHVDAIIELAGPGDRDARAIELAKEHHAPVLVQSTVASDAKSDTCLQPIPDVTIECFHPEPETTRGEARWIGEEAAARHWSSIIIVTTPDHAWRARLRVERCFPGEVYVAESPLPKLDWLKQIPYQWAATVKAELFQRDC